MNELEGAGKDYVIKTDKYIKKDGKDGHSIIIFFYFLRKVK